jgi:hypothetical protein
MEVKIKCNACKNMYPQKIFFNKYNKLVKTCTLCRDKAKNKYQEKKCKHNRKADVCIECDGLQICKHKKVRSRCKECGGGSYCLHKKRRSTCKDCKGGGLCVHEREKSKCKDCKGSSICEHNRERNRCKDCKGRSICEHNRIRSACSKCKGGSICEHHIMKNQCKYCDFNGYLTKIVRFRMYDALKNEKKNSTLEYLGCDIVFFRKYIEKKFVIGMSWENYGSAWHIDHITPIKYKENDDDIISIEEIEKRLHYTNTQPLWASENISKGNKYIG